MSIRILLVEDEEDLVQTLEYRLAKEGFQVESSLTGRGGIEACKRETLPDLILLDLMLPDMTGNEVCRQIRMDPRTRAIPVIMVTARTEEIDRVVGFEVGADDYISKPFSMRELMLRIRAVHRRSKRAKATATEVGRGRLRVDEKAHRAWVDGHEVDLTVIEFKLLVHFLAHPGEVQTRERLLADVWGYREGIASRTVDTHVKRLRSKLGDTGRQIETLRGVGYRFVRASESS
jgi:two-component system phosphate regulon response regulator PhoB